MGLVARLVLALFGESYPAGFTPTHLLTLNGKRFEVMLVNGAAYTWQEWANAAPTEWTCLQSTWRYRDRIPGRGTFQVRAL